MPIKGESKEAIVHTEMHKFKEGELHSGSEEGPVVHSREQAEAIAMKESGQHRPQHKPSPGAHGFGHSASQRHGHLRMSGHKGAHRIGKR